VSAGGTNTWLTRTWRRGRSVATRIGRTQTRSHRIQDSRRHWSATSDPEWAANSHWRSGLADEDWLATGRDHFAMYEVFARALDLTSRPHTVIEWGCGGGANAVVFAPIANTFIAADISAESVDECVRQVRSVCDTPVEPVVIDIENPGGAVDAWRGSCDLFVCVYVLELTPSRDDAWEIMRIARDLLVPGGMAFVQFKYETSSWRTRSHRRDYRHNFANMTTFAVDEFWSEAIGCGLTPRLITLVPQNRLDKRYAYCALIKP
jgi:hypothetical protein